VRPTQTSVASPTPFLVTSDIITSGAHIPTFKVPYRSASATVVAKTSDLSTRVTSTSDSIPQTLHKSSTLGTGAEIPPAVTVTSQPSSAHPTGSTITSATVSPGGSSLTISGSHGSPAPFGPAVGNTIVPIQDPTQSLATSILPITSQVSTANRKGSSSAGASLASDRSAVTVDGTPSSPGSSDQVLGSSISSLISFPPGSVELAFTIGDQTSTPNPTGFPLASVTLSPDPGISVSGASGPLVHSSTAQLNRSPTDLRTESALTIAGQTITPNPTGFPIAGTTLLPVSGITISEITIPGTTIRLGSSGLVIHFSTVQLTTALTDLRTESALTIAGQTITPNPTGFSIAGTTLLPNSDFTISATKITIESSYILYGNSTITIPPPTSISGNSTVFSPNSTSSDQYSSFSTVSTTNQSSTTSSKTADAPGSTTTAKSPPLPSKGAAARMSLRHLYAMLPLWVMCLTGT